jgi:succinoglycan biosynthesis transport protein ExoP
MPQELQIVASPGMQRSLTLRDVAAVFFRHQGLLLVSFSIIAVSGILYSAFFPSYKAEMKVLLRRGRIDPAVTPTPSPAPAFEHDEITEEELNSEVELLRDDDLLRQVVLEAGLGQKTWFSVVTGQNAEERTEHAVRRLAAKLEVQPVRKSRLITISYSSPDAARSAAVLNSLSRFYLAKHASNVRPSGQQTFFEQQMNQSQLVLHDAQSKLIAFTRNRGVFSAALERDLALQKLSDAAAVELGIESAMAEVGARLRTLEANLSNLPQRRVVEIKNADNPQLEERLKSKLLELELQRTALITKFQPSYRLVQEVDEQIAQAKSAIDAEELKPLRDETTQDDPEFDWAHAERLKSEVELRGLAQKREAAREQVLEYRAVAGKLEESAVAQQDFEQQVKAAEDKYLLYSNKREEARIGDALDRKGVLNVAIAESARPPALPVWSFMAAACLSFVGAAGFSTAIIFVTDYFAPTFRTPGEVFECLGSPVLASLPAIRDIGRDSEAS